MSSVPTSLPAVEAFVARWQGVTASELATAQSFVIDLCRRVSDVATSLPAPARAMTQQVWPATLPEQLAAVARVIADSPTAQTEAQLAASFTGKGRWKSRLPDILAALEALGRARATTSGWVAG